jgi:hypothetical protein
LPDIYRSLLPQQILSYGTSKHLPLKPFVYLVYESKHEHEHGPENLAFGYLVYTYEHDSEGKTKIHHIFTGLYDTIESPEDYPPHHATYLNLAISAIEKDMAQHQLHPSQPANFEKVSVSRLATSTGQCLASSAAHPGRLGPSYSYAAE